MYPRAKYCCREFKGYIQQFIRDYETIIGIDKYFIITEDAYSHVQLLENPFMYCPFCEKEL